MSPRPTFPPGRGYRWKDFEPGNEVALRHGAYSPRKVDPRARQIVEAALSSGPEYLADESYSSSLWLWATTMARVELYAEWLGEQGEFPEKNRWASEQFTKLKKLASDLGSKLGLDPSTRARIQRDLSVGAHAMANVDPQYSEGRKIREEAMARIAAEKAALPVEADTAKRTRFRDPYLAGPLAEGDGHPLSRPGSAYFR